MNDLEKLDMILFQLFWKWQFPSATIFKFFSFFIISIESKTMLKSIEWVEEKEKHF